jgi:hypothetical protein
MSLLPLTGNGLAIRVLVLVGTWALTLSTLGQPFQATLSRPVLDRWMYPFNATPGSRPVAAVFGTLGDEAGVDSRHGQFLVGFDLSGVAPTNRGPDRYLLTRVRLSLVVSRDRGYPLDPTEDPVASYLEPGAPGYVPDEDPARPVELFGVGYRNGFSDETFLEDSPFGSAAAGGRNAFAAGYGGDGVLVDVGNSVGKTNEVFPVFQARPFALGQVEGWPAGEPVSAGTVMTFDVNLQDPWVTGYLRQALHTGRLRWALTSLHESGFGGVPTFAEFYTQDSAVGVAPSLEVEGVVIRDEDTDGDGLPDDWERSYFGGLAEVASGDKDSDGVSNAREYRDGTQPTDPLDRWAVSVVRGPGGPTLRLEFGHVPNRQYRVEATTDGVNWEEAAQGLFRHDVHRGKVVWEETKGGSAPALRSHRFYRVASESAVALGSGGH